jgi:hypothetical protein
MPSNFKGTWQGSGVVESPAKIEIEDVGDEPMTVTFTDSKGSRLSLTVDTKAPLDISFLGKDEDKNKSYIGRLVIFSASPPVLLAGSICTTFGLGPIGDTNVDVFIAVKTS